MLIGMICSGPVGVGGGFGLPEGTPGTGERGLGIAKAEPKDNRAKAKEKARRRRSSGEPSADPITPEA